MPKAVPPRETPISGATVIPAGRLVVIKDTNTPVVNPVTQTAAALIASIPGATVLTTIDVSARSGAFPSGLQIFETF